MPYTTRSDPDTSWGNRGDSWEFGSGLGIRGHALGGPSEAAGARLSRSLSPTEKLTGEPCPLPLRDGPLTPAPDPSSRKSPRSRGGNGIASSFPSWLHRPLAVHGQWELAKSLTRELKLHTVCEEARCPNLGECWSHGNVSFMILGDRCTRRCAFCAVATGRPLGEDLEEPLAVAEAVARLKLQYVVITSVARDDLPDEGSGAFAETIRAIKRRVPSAQVEVLTPDFHAHWSLLKTVVDAGPQVYAHNLETVRRLSRSVRPQADYRRSLEVLRIAKELGQGQLKTKSGLMVGLGEEPEEVRQAMVDLGQVGCEILTIGQYLQPTSDHRAVTRFVSLEQFSIYRAWGLELGFSFVASGPFVRSSYNAFEALKGVG